MCRMSVEIAVSTRDLFWEGLDDIAKSKRVKPLVAASVGSYGTSFSSSSSSSSSFLFFFLLFFTRKESDGF